MYSVDILSLEKQESGDNYTERYSVVMKLFCQTTASFVPQHQIVGYRMSVEERKRPI